MKLSLFRRKKTGAKSKVPGQNQGSSTGNGSNGPARKILLVDDEESFGRLAKKSLESVGPYDVRTETRARDAVQAALEFKPDLVLLDIMMPDGDGGQIAARFQEHEALRDIPVIFLTASIKRNQDGQSMRTIGGRNYIPKPVKVAELMDCIERLCAS